MIGLVKTSRTNTEALITVLVKTLRFNIEVL